MELTINLYIYFLKCSCYELPILNLSKRWFGYLAVILFLRWAKSQSATSTWKTKWDADVSGLDNGHQ